MANGEELTQFDSVNPMTQTDQETLVTVAALDAVTSVAGGDFTAPAPTDLVGVDFDKKAVTQTVADKAISTAHTVAAAGTVSYTQISTSDEVTNDTLNKTAETLKNSVNNVLSGFDTKIETGINALASETKSALTELKSTTNSAFQNVKTQMDDQVIEIDDKVDAAVSEVNDALEEIRTKNISQNNDIAAKINTVSGELAGNTGKLKDAIDDLAGKVQAIDDVYMTDADMAERVTAVNDLIETLRGADMDVVGSLSGITSEVNGLSRIETKSISMAAAGGLYNFNILAEGFTEMAAAGDYEVEAEIMGNAKAQVSVLNKSDAGFDLDVKSNGVHFVPQPIDGSVNPVTISVKVIHSKHNPLTFQVDELDDAWLTDGNGTDTSTVPSV